MMSSTFYSNAIELRGPSDKIADDNAPINATLHLTIDTVSGLPVNSNLIYCRATTGPDTAKTFFQSQQEANVEFNQTLSMELSVTEQKDGAYIPSVFYVLIEIRDRSNNDERLCNTMLPVYWVTSHKTLCTLRAGTATLTLYTVLELPEDFVNWQGTETLLSDCTKTNLCWSLTTQHGMLNLPGTAEVCEVCVRDAQITMGQIKFSATVYLTNFRVVIICCDGVNKSYSTYINYSVIDDIEKSYETECGVRYCSYKFKCSDVRIIKISVLANRRTRKIKEQSSETKLDQNNESPSALSVLAPSSGSVSSSDLVFTNQSMSANRSMSANQSMSANCSMSANRSASTNSKMSTAAKMSSRLLTLTQKEVICSSDGEANEAPSDNDNLCGEGMFEEHVLSSDITSLAQLEYSDDDFLSDRLDSVSTVLSDVDSVDSLDSVLDRTTSISSFTSYLIPKTRSRSKGLKKRRRTRHISKVSMDAVRARIVYVKENRELFIPLIKEHQNIVTQLCDLGLPNIPHYTECSRLGIQSDWRAVDNTDYGYCKSYPPLFYIPSLITDVMLKQVLQFRSKGRIPALSWLRGSAVLLRSAQPKIGMFQNYCEEDELLLNTVRQLSQSTLQFMIFDARSKIAAGGNRMKGKGTEDAALRYQNTQLIHLDMANIHAIRDSHDRLASLCQTQCTPRWYTKLESVHWLNHIQGLLQGAHLISSHLLSGGAALVHCSDGWDRTSQLTSLSLLLIDSYYRTHQGFSLLIEREWLAFGHRFHDRLGYAHPSQRSPIFLLWLDALYQVMCQAPTSFEFSTDYILNLADLYSSEWTQTFLKNCPRERDSDGGVSVWNILDGLKGVLSNPLYQHTEQPIILRTSLRHITLWKEYWLRYDTFTAIQAQRNVVIWEPDNDVVQCRLCRELFSALRRKHHCRSCGYVFCYQCARRRIVLPEMGYNTPVLVCDTCHRDHSGKI